MQTVNLRDTIERLRAGGLPEIVAALKARRERLLAGPGQVVIAGLAVFVIATAIAFLVWPTPPVILQDERFIQVEQDDRKALMALTPAGLAAEEKKRSAAAAAAGDDDADYALAALERARRVREEQATSLTSDPSTRFPIQGAP